MSTKTVSVSAVLLVFGLAGCGAGDIEEAPAPSPNTPPGQIPPAQSSDGRPSGEANLGALQVGRFVNEGVDGLAYETSSGIAGVTAQDGSFDYRVGDVVTFAVGELVVGSAPGQAELTVFDVVGAVAPEVCDETAFGVALVDARFRSALNLETLLHTLDADADASNGIVIAPEVAALFGDAPVDFHLAPNRFDNERPFRSALTQANELGLFGSHRIVANHRAVAEHLLDFSSSCRQVTHMSFDSDAPASWAETITRNSDGRIVEKRRMGVLSHVFAYDALGRLTTEEEFGNEGGSEHRGEYVYDDRGLLLGYEHFFRDVRDVVHTYTYDQDGNRLTSHQVGPAFDGADAYDELVTATYDAFGNVTGVTIERTTTDPQSGVSTVHPVDVRTYTYDDNNDQLTFDNNGLVTTLFYGSEHLLSGWERPFENTAPTVHTIERDEAGREVRHEVVTWATTYLDLKTYDGAGLLTRLESFQDGALKSVQTRSYDALGRMIELDNDPGSVKTQWSFDDENGVELRQRIHKQSLDVLGWERTHRDVQANTELWELDTDGDDTADLSRWSQLEDTGVGIRFERPAKVLVPGWRAP